MGCYIMDNESNNKLAYKNSNVFYETLYTRLFNLIDMMIQENEYNINIVKDKIEDFCDTYAYYIIGKNPLKSKKDKEAIESDNNIKDKINDFDNFTKGLTTYPTQEFNKIRLQFKEVDYSLSKLSDTQYETLIREYYKFFNECILIISKFVAIASVNGFLPIIKSKRSLRTIGYANYDLFFKELEKLKLNVSIITTTIKPTQIFKSRRAIYSLIIVLSPYFKRLNILKEFTELLDFSFLDDDDKLRLIKNSYNYDTYLDMGDSMKKELLEIAEPFKLNVKYVKRYISMELGEVELNPLVKKKYDYDPTWT